MANTDKVPVIAIIGAGFSGLVTAYELVAQTKKPIKILLFDGSPYAKKGIAYTTDCPLHLLNIHAINMGALHTDPEHFFKWMSNHPTFKDLPIHPHSFIPRMIYGKYLEEFFSHTNSVQYIPENIIDIEDPLKVKTEKGEYKVDAVLLALGVPGSQKLAGIKPSPRLLEALWPDFADMKKAKALLEKCDEKSVVGIIGSGLTMLDAIATLHYLKYPGKIIVFSQKGLLPQSHLDTPDAHTAIKHENFEPKALDILRKIRTLTSSSNSWYKIIDGMRPITSQLWKKLPLKEKQKVIRHLFTLWNSHRHRAAPEIRKLIHQYLTQGQLEFIKKRAHSIEDKGNKIAIKIPDSQILVDLAINCSGPELYIRKHPSPLIQNVLKKGYGKEDELGMGFMVDSRGALLGKVPSKIFTLGALLFGTHFETTSVPELREQCHTVAKHILESVCK